MIVAQPLRPTLLTSLALCSLLLVPGCTSDASVNCGVGTRLEGATCVPEPMDMVDGSATAPDGDAASDVGGGDALVGPVEDSLEDGDGLGPAPDGSLDSDSDMEAEQAGDAEVAPVAEDQDQDGVTLAEGDCDDADPSTYPGAPEVFEDGIDHDCDGSPVTAMATCSAGFTARFPDGTEASLDGCKEWSVTPTLDFDPDDSPTLVHLAINLSAKTSAGFTCDVSIVLAGPCAPGYYPVGEALSVTFDLSDCVGVSDPYEAVYTATTGYLRIDKVDTGELAGDFLGAPLGVGMDAHFRVSDPSGVELEGDLTLFAEQIVSLSAQATGCLALTGDSDEDGFVSADFDGEDCDDGAAAIYPGAPAEGCSGVDVNCDGTLSCQFSHISAGEDFTCGVTTAGALKCWGSDVYDEGSPPEGSFATVSAGRRHACALTPAGEVACWGSNENALGETTNQSNAPPDQHTVVSAGGHHTCAVNTVGEMNCWGWNNKGQTGPFPNEVYVQVSAGTTHTCAVTQSGFVECWGENFEGQAWPSGGEFTSIAAGLGHTCALEPDGEVECWGNNLYGQKNPPQLPFTSISACFNATCGVTDESQVVCWGKHYDPEDAAVLLYSIPDGEYAQVACGADHACALDAKGEVTCWGEDAAGETVVPSF